ncbi:MAG: phosphate ABC transporter permease subunit PstC [Armatimonadetes bacterium CG2_30_59_28]|nr:phosphate ABC transporter permease subunit PstC [Armatimonadota bacterium]OIO96987.1 MAG: phosphate ABC transporter permease subunit PstC [Armatimonadetes bacterium CG2_30_59_28]PIU64224.1 MAG: phosphate ABC transporter permease subunit PstC [Armatimonadetes bacterium CG07_land_8_20_14_0_80_59_28]PIY49018.1 MAG: phosphate ABC transporter permease subunit PstC [Armatimonadetes bacterium CG_4_10_14_3_um_filter_59_10]PJB78742.1 MAG: phosphate ABC transporter permease subunit PstC [Armatimonadet
MHQRSRFDSVREFIVEKTVLLSGLASIVFVLLIFVFLLKEGLRTFGIVSLEDFLLGRKWYPISSPPKFGILPLIGGTLAVTVGATLLSVPFGIASAFYIAEVAGPRMKEMLKTGIELLAAIPSVVIGFLGMVIVAPFIGDLFDLPTGQTALSGAVMLSLMAMPTIVSIAEDAITAIPGKYREAALALGATRWEYICRIAVRAAAPGIVAAVMLGIGRVIGETMAVMMITGNSAQIPHSLLQPVRTMTATIAAEMGETVPGGDHYAALFAIGLVLFVITFFVNLVADVFLHKDRGTVQ